MNQKIIEALLSEMVGVTKRFAPEEALIIFAHMQNVADVADKLISVAGVRETSKPDYGDRNILEVDTQRLWRRAVELSDQKIYFIKEIRSEIVSFVGPSKGCYIGLYESKVIVEVMSYYLGYDTHLPSLLREGEKVLRSPTDIVDRDAQEQWIAQFLGVSYPDHLVVLI